MTNDSGTPEQKHPPRTSRTWRTIAVVVGCIAIVLALLWLRSRKPTESSPLPRCAFHMSTGLHCPGCGGTRMAHHLLNGRVAPAFRCNPVTFLLLPFLIYGITSEAKRFITGQGLPYARLNPPAIWCLFGFLVLYWVIRNIPVYPLTLLAPP